MADSVECVQVVVRCRPLNQKEIARGCNAVVSVDESTGEILIGNSDNRSKSSNNEAPSFYATTKKQESNQFPSKMFTFDKAFGEKLAVCLSICIVVCFTHISLGYIIPL